MSRPTTVTADLKGYSLDELKKLRKSYHGELGRNILTAIIMLTEGNSVKQIANFLLQREVSVYIYINRWNEHGMKSLEDKRGKTPSNCKITAEMEDDLVQTVTHRLPNDFGLIGNVWTAKLLAEYLYQNYEVRCCEQAIRNLLHKNNFSFKRAQKRPTKGNKSEQEAFKKNGSTGTYCRKRF
ncbi:MAG: helix-turn-helix domain-containing protein [Peptostreptococcaceae bacterium]